jgi:hypothetical protein
MLATNMLAFLCYVTSLSNSLGLHNVNSFLSYANSSDMVRGPAQRHCFQGHKNRVHCIMFVLPLR